MNQIERFNTLENTLIANFRQLDIWNTIPQLRKENLKVLLKLNYIYSSQFLNILELALENAITPEAKIAIEHIVHEESSPIEHIELHKNMLDACQIEVSSCYNLETHNPLAQLIEVSKKYACPKTPLDDLSMLCFFRLGSEILAGELYSSLIAPVKNQFSVEDKDIIFITLHAEHDCKTTDLGIDPDGHKDAHGNYPHADHFNIPITNFLNSLQDSTFERVEKAYKDSFLLRKGYIEHLVSASLSDKSLI